MNNSVWQLNARLATLRAGGLTAEVNLDQPAQGLHLVKWKSLAVEGSVLGVSVAHGLEETNIDVRPGCDGYARGSDLVATYPQHDGQRFSLQMYWRATAVESAVVVDAILSFQTELLESFPGAILSTRLPVDEMWVVGNQFTETRQIGTADEETVQLTSDEPVGILLRSPEQAWSYCEATCPQDLGTWHLDTDGVGHCRLSRRMGGEFQEKGVIRRLRTIGVFLPRANDLEVAARLIDHFAASPPPLTV
jgi:hypothetical protein